MTKAILKPCMVLLMVVFCSLPPATADMGSNKLELVILKQDWYDIKLGYIYTQALPLLESANSSGHLHVISLNDIEMYHWARQSILLTPEATDRLIAALPKDEEIKKPIQYMARVKKERGWGNAIEPALHLKGFLVTLDNKIIYAGIFLEPMSELAARYPVIRPQMRGKKAVLNLLPIQMPFVVYDPDSEDVALWTKAIAPEGASMWSQFPPEMKRKS